MQPSIKRRTFLQALFGLPALAFMRPRAQTEPPPYDGLTFTDSDGNAALAALADNNLDTGIPYGA